MHKVLITGGAGFIGSYLSNRLIKENYLVDVVDNQLRGDYTRLHNRVKIYNIDLTKFEELSKLPKNYDWIFHLAAVNGTDNFYKIQSKVFEVGVKSCLNIYDYFKHSKSSIIVASSAEVYQTPTIVPTNENVPLGVQLSPSNLFFFNPFLPIEHLNLKSSQIKVSLFFNLIIISSKIYGKSKIIYN